MKHIFTDETAKSIE